MRQDIVHKTYSKISLGSRFSRGHLKNEQGPMMTSGSPSLIRLSLSLCHTQTIHSIARSRGSS